jgi:hypothetical protein
MGKFVKNFLQGDQVKNMIARVAESRGIPTNSNGLSAAFTAAPTTPATPAPLQFDNPERAGRIEASLGRAAFGPDRIREILMQLKESNFLAEGGMAKIKTNGMSFEEWLKGKQNYDMEELYNDYLEDLKQQEFERKYPRNEAADGGLMTLFSMKR